MEKTESKNLRKNNKKKGRGLTIAIVVVLVLALLFFVVLPMLSPRGAEYKTYTVKRGSVRQEVMASGYVATSETEDIELPAGVEVTDIAVKAGEAVSTDTVLAALDAASVQNAYNTYEMQLRSIDSELNALKMQAGGSAATVSSSVSGRVKAVYCEEGDDVLAVVSEYGALALISTDGNMRIVPDSDDALALGMEVTVRLGDDELDAKLTRHNGMIVALVDDDSIDIDDEAYILAENGEILAQGKAEVNAPATVIYSSGVIDDVYVKVNDRVSMGGRIARVTDTQSLAYSAKLNEREDCAEKLSELAQYIRDPHVYAGFDGFVKAINVTEGASAASQSGAMGAMGTAAVSAPAFVIAKQGAMEINASIDELDITAVAVDQNVRISVNAIEDTEFTGHVSFAAGLGGAQTGFTATVVLDDADERVMEGMYANVYITTAEVKDALVVPLEIVEEDIDGEFVYIANGEERTKTYIKTGLSDGMTVEIIEGLQEGDVLSYEQTDQRLMGMMRFFSTARNNMTSRFEGDDTPAQSGGEE